MQLQNLCSLRLNVEEDLFKELARLPEELVDTYDQIFEHVGRLAPQSRVIAERSLKWLLCQATELSEAEFLAAVSIGIERESVDITKETILFICGNLVIFDHALKVFRFAHLSVREYLEAQRNLTLGAAHALGGEISLLICLQRCTELTAKCARTFRPYAFVYWLYHCREAKKSGLGSLLYQLLEDFLHVQEGTNLCYAAWARSMPRLRQASKGTSSSTRSYWRDWVVDDWGRESDDESIDVLDGKEWLTSLNAWGSRLISRKEDLIPDSILGDQDFPFGTDKTERGMDSDAWRFRSKLRNRREDLILNFILSDRDCPYDPTFAACFLDLPEIVEHNLRSVLSSSAKKVGVSASDNIKALKRRNLRSVLSSSAKKVGVSASDNIKAFERRNMYGETYLHVACHRGSSKLLRLMLQYPVPIHAMDILSRTALHYAIHPRGLVSFQPAGWTETVRNAHHPANAAERIAMIGLLIEKGGIIDAIDYIGETALHRASHANFCTQARFLLDHGAFVDARIRRGRTPLQLAVEKGNTAVVQLLLQHKADMEARDSNEKTPLQLAVGKGNTAVAQLLLQHKADMEARDSNGKTPLLQAAELGHTAVAQLLLQCKADIEARDSNGKTPLLRAAELGHTAVAQLLLQFKADIEARDEYKRTPLFQTAKVGYLDTARLLFRLGADINAKDSCDVTILAESLLRRQEAMAQMLIDKGASVKELDMSGNTVLHYAVRSRLGATISRLLEMGACNNETNAYGSTPLHVAIDPYCTFPGTPYGDSKAFPIVQLLVDAGADVEMSDDGRRTPLHLAAKMADEASIQILLDRGANVKAEDGKGLLPLDHAALSGSLQVFSILFERWSNVMAESGECAVETWLRQAAKPVNAFNKVNFEILPIWRTMSVEDLVEFTTPNSKFRKNWVEKGSTWYRARLIVREMRARREARIVPDVERGHSNPLLLV